MQLTTEAYLGQADRWPPTGRHILAQFDHTSIVVYQAYNASIARYAVQHQTFGGEFRFTRMSWLKTNFLWMMYRSGWGTKPQQEITLAIRIQRTGFDYLLREAVHAHFIDGIYPDYPRWQAALTHSSVRLQWDPDHDPSGRNLERRAIQLGIRDDALRRYAEEWIIDIEDISDFVAEQRPYAQTPTTYLHLRTPHEDVYPVDDAATIQPRGFANP